MRRRRRRVRVLAEPPAASWTADPDDQFLLDVNIRQLRLGDGVRAYTTPEGTCVVFGDFLTALDVPMKIDLAAKKASGWAFKETNRIAIDYAARQSPATAARAKPIAAGHDPRDARRLVRPDRGAGPLVRHRRQAGDRPARSLILESEAKLPVELAVERAAARRAPQAGQLRPRRACRRCALPYRMWRAPALDFVVSAGVTYRASDGVRVDRQSSVYAAGEIAQLSYDAQLTTTAEGHAEHCCACAPTAPTPTAGCSDRSKRPISASATSQASTAA